MSHEPMTIPRLARLAAEGQRITMLTAYEFWLARLVDRAGVDVVLVGDSGAMVNQGYRSTLPMRLEEMVSSVQAVRRGVERALLVADLPFMSYQVSSQDAVRNAGHVMKQGECEAVKLEGGRTMAHTVRAVVEAGIPVMGHVGMTPQRVSQYGGYRVQGRTPEDARGIVADAQALEDAGAFAVVLECIPSDVGAAITDQLTIPTIGIGAGPSCNGQVLVTHDLLGLYGDVQPRFVRRYVELSSVIVDACTQFCADVRGESFPNANESYGELAAESTRSQHE